MIYRLFQFKSTFHNYRQINDCHRNHFVFSYNLTLNHWKIALLTLHKHTCTYIIRIVIYIWFILILISILYFLGFVYGIIMGAYNVFVYYFTLLASNHMFWKVSFSKHMILNGKKEARCLYKVTFLFKKEEFRDRKIVLLN